MTVMFRFLPFLVVSMTIHVIGVFACGGLLQSAALVAGYADGDPDSVFVTVVAENDLFAEAPTPAQADSVESRPEKAQEEKEKEVEEKSPPLLTQKTQDPSPEFPESLEPAEEPELPKEQPVAKEKEQEASDASLPQIASDSTRRQTALGSEVRDFQSKILAAIREATFFPKKALEKRRYGEAVVTFTVNRTGPLSGISLTASSGSDILDEAAQEIVRKAGEKFPPFPSLALQNSITYSVPILFTKKRSKN